MTDSLKHFVKSLVKKTGFDIVKVETFESLLRELDFQKKKFEAWKTDQDRCLEAYKTERSIIPYRPASYRYVENSQHEEVLVFVTATNADFDWLEEAIFAHGYYEKPNIWSLAVDANTRFLAEMIQSLDPKTTLDFGCANGSLLLALDDLGIAGEGVEICSFALERALPRVRNRIHHGDILKLAIEESSYDVISGLDIFEHLNPNKIGAYLEKIWRILKPGGFVFANIPAFGTDEIFGEIFECYLPDWETDRASGSCFRTIHVDMHGYPMHGHLIWADTEWWAGLFKKQGFLRITEREKELHRRYDGKLFYARRSFYVFQKPA